MAPPPDRDADSVGSHLQRWKLVDDLRGLHRHGDHAGEQVQDVTGVADFAGPAIGVVDDAGCLVGLYVVAIDDPLDCGPESR
jgi:hypothetical protein